MTVWPLWAKCALCLSWPQRLHSISRGWRRSLDGQTASRCWQPADVLSSARLASDITTGLIQDPVHWGPRPTVGVWIRSEIKSHVDDVPLSGVCHFELSLLSTAPLLRCRARRRIVYCVKCTCSKDNLSSNRTCCSTTQRVCNVYAGSAISLAGEMYTSAQQSAVLAWFFLFPLHGSSSEEREGWAFHADTWKGCEVSFANLKTFHGCIWKTMVSPVTFSYISNMAKTAHFDLFQIPNFIQKKY